MTIAGVDLDGRFVPLDEDAQPPALVAELLTWGHLASDARPVDPIDLAFARACEHLSPSSALLINATRAREYPLSNALLAAANGWTFSDGRRAVAAKGAPEAIATLCRLDEDATAALLMRVAQLARDGLRVLAVARTGIDTHFPDELLEHPFECLGLVAFSDPVRPTVPGAIRECRDAGIRVLMLTGDYPATALAVARTIALDTQSGVVTGAELAAMDDAALAGCVGRTSVFARVLPEQKLRLVRALQANGEVVAMTGDGVNDAPALKAADIGVAMGLRGTDVAREAAALVLLDDDFASIVGAVRLGRRVYDNIRKASGYVLAIHLPIAGMSLLPPLLQWPLVLLPLHVIFMELIVDPACSIAFEMEPEEGDVMARPPRDPDERLFDRRLVARSVLQGLGMLGASFAVYAWTRRAGMGDGDVRALTFTTLIVTNLILIFANRSLTRSLSLTRVVTARNPALLTIVAGALTALAGVLYVPPVRALFSLSRPHVSDLLVCLVAALAALVWMELLKVAERHAGS
jgi:Ca2+-transporting ATPase